MQCIHQSICLQHNITVTLRMLTWLLLCRLIRWQLWLITLPDSFSLPLVRCCSGLYTIAHRAPRRITSRPLILLEENFPLHKFTMFMITIIAFNHIQMKLSANWKLLIPSAVDRLEKLISTYRRDPELNLGSPRWKRACYRSATGARRSTWVNRVMRLSHTVDSRLCSL
jgi:hypothetical protein